MRTKWILTVFFGVSLSFLIPQKVNACDIEFEITKGKKESYNVGDTIVVVVKVALTHRSCPVKLNKTKFKLKGLKVVKSTQWKQLSANDWERKLMIVVTGSKGKKLNLTAIRECDKDGGFGTLKLNMAE